MTTQALLHHLRPTTLAQIAAELVISDAEEVHCSDDYEFNFTTADARLAYSDVIEALIANTGETDAFALLDQALAAEWDAYHDYLFHN